MHELIRALTSLLRQQQGTLQRIEEGIGTVGDELAKVGGQYDDGAAEGGV